MRVKLIITKSMKDSDSGASDPRSGPRQVPRLALGPEGPEGPFQPLGWMLVFCVRIEVLKSVS